MKLVDHFPVHFVFQFLTEFLFVWMIIPQKHIINIISPGRLVEPDTAEIARGTSKRRARSK